MYKLTLTLLLALAMIFTVTSHAEETPVQEQLVAAQSKIKQLTESNTQLKQDLSNYENEILAKRQTLAKLETEIEKMKGQLQGTEQAQQE